MIHSCFRNSRFRHAPGYFLAATLALTVLVGCSGEESDSAREPATRITVEQARSQTVRETETTVGRVQSRALPAISAETSGRVLEVVHDVGDQVAKDEVLLRLDDLNQHFAVRQAEGAVDRLEAMITNQERTVRRQRELLNQNSISRSQFDAAEAELASLRAQLRETQARLEEAQLALEKTRVTSPVDGFIEDRLVSEGDFVSPGTPLYRMVGGTRLRITLPYPERIAHRISPGQTVRLQMTAADTAIHEAEISDLRPAIGTASRSIDAIIHMENPGNWRSGASVTGTLILETRQDAVTVPENSVVRRPDGQVVYVIEDERARQRLVETGVRINGRVEILSGIEVGETIAATGAQFLSDGGRVIISNETDGSESEEGAGDSGEEDNEGDNDDTA